MKHIKMIFALAAAALCFAGIAMRNKRFISALAVALFAAALSRADDFSDALHDLAAQTACLGQYTVRQGDNYDYIPGDYYTPEIARRFGSTSGIRASGGTFNGVCFDYSLAAYRVIDANQSLFNRLGMYEDQFFMASISLGDSAIRLRYPTTRDGATTLQNGVYVTTTVGGIPMRDTGTRHRMTHKHIDGTRATHHAWLWVERNDGVWFWIDPTWTDNVGYVVWGYVANDEEVQLRPDESFCVNYPSYLNDLPAAPAPGRRKAPSGSGSAASVASAGGSSSGRSSSGGSSGGGSSGGSSSSGYGHSGVSSPSSIVISAGYAAPFSAMFGGGFGISFGVEDGNLNAPGVIGMYQLDYYRYGGKDALLFDVALGLQLARAFALYGGAGLGFSGDGMSALYDIRFAWKAYGGVRVTIRRLYLRAEAQYVDGLGSALGAFVGWGF